MVAFAEVIKNCTALAFVTGATAWNQKTLDSKESNKLSCTRPLPDLLHDHTPDLRRYEHYIDLIPLSLAAIVLYLIATQHPKVCTLTLLERISTALFVRLICTRATVLPSPICNKYNSAPRAIGGCHDCIFSGHTVITLLLAHQLLQCFPEHKEALFVYCILGSLAIVVTRSHYTIDVIVAWIVAYALTTSKEEC